MSKSTLTQELERQQKVLALDDGAFAEKLGISRPQWVLIKQGKMRPGMTLLSGVAQTFPGLKDLVLDELAAYKRSQDSSAVPA